jgi:hypothetical protein
VFNRCRDFIGVVEFNGERKVGRAKWKYDRMEVGRKQEVKDSWKEYRKDRK